MTADELIKKIMEITKGVEKDKRPGEKDEEYKARKKKEDAEYLVQRNELEEENLRIKLKQQKALGEMFEAQQTGLELLGRLQEQAYGPYKDLAELKEATANAENEQEKKRLQAQLERATAIENEIKDLEKLTEGAEKYTKAQESAKDAAAGLFTDIATKIGLNSKAANAFSDQLEKMRHIAKNNKTEMGQAFMETFSIQKIGLALTFQIIAATLKLATAVDKASAAFAAQTGAGRALTTEISNIGGSYRNLGLGAEEAGKAAQTLFNNFTGFMQASRQERQTLMLTVASLEKIGVSGEAAANSLNILTKNFDMSTNQAARMTKQLAIAGTKIGISAQKMMDGFVAASKSLAVYGKDAINVFTDLAAQAKAAGVEAQTLLGIAERFDTFEGAADSAGKLNSILGTQMSATDMLMMKENERIETLIRSIQAQGIAFKDLDRYSQKAVASAAGISDMAEAQRIFGMSVSDYRKGLQEAASEEEFNQRLKDAMDIFAKLTKIAQNFAIQMAPVIDLLASAAQKFLDWSQSMNGVPVMILGVVAAVMLAIKVLPILTAVFMGTITAVGSFGSALPALVPGIVMFGAAVLGLFAVFAIGLAMLDTEALSALGSVFSGLFGGEKEVNMTARMNMLGDANDFIDNASAKVNKIEPLMGDLALIATGKTTQDITTKTANYSFNKFAAEFNNVFQPKITVEIDGAAIEGAMAKYSKA